MTFAALGIRTVANLDPQIAALALVLQKEPGGPGEATVAATLLMFNALGTVFLAFAPFVFRYITVLFDFVFAVAEKTDTFIYRDSRQVTSFRQVC